MVKYLLALCLPLFLLFSCSYQKLEFEKASGKYNKIKSGENFRISLPEDHKTKFYWGIQHEYDKKTISYIASIFHGTYVDFNFEALAPGKTEITFNLNGYNEVKETKTFLIEVE
jgi:predicted secreted protein